MIIPKIQTKVNSNFWLSAPLVLFPVRSSARFSKCSDPVLTLILTLAAIRDPNNDDFGLFESGAIVSYLIDRYDTSHALSDGSSSETLKLQQWFHLQASRQRACFAAATWYVLQIFCMLFKPPF